MQKPFVTFLALALIHGTEEAVPTKSKRFIPHGAFAAVHNFGNFLPTTDFSFLTGPSSISTSYTITNLLEDNSIHPHIFDVSLSAPEINAVIKPVYEETDHPSPPQPRPVVNLRPVSVGSGSLGVVQLANGGFVLGSGSIGFSPGGQQQSPAPRPQVAQLQIPNAPEYPLNALSSNVISLNYFPLNAGVAAPSFLRYYLPYPEQPQVANSPTDIGMSSDGNNTQQVPVVQDVGPVQDNTVMRISVPESRGYSTTLGLSGFRNK